MVELEVIVGVLILAVPPAFVLFVVILEVVFRRSDTGRLWRRLIDAEKSVKKRLKRVDREIKGAERRMRDAANTYENGYVRRLLRRRPIRDLKPYVSVSMSWSALANAGITDLEKFMSFRGNFRQLRGIGESRSQALRQARRKLSEELAESTLPMPTLRGPGTLEYEVVTTALRSARLYGTVRPKMEKVEQRQEELKQFRPGSLGVRWKHWFGDREGLQNQLRDCVDEFTPLADQEAPQLEQMVHDTGMDDDYDRLGELYQEHEQTVKKLLNRSTKRDVRGALRPVGAAAMRAAEGFDDEEDFCDRALEPLVAKLGYNHRREHTITRRIGSREKSMYVDFFLLDEYNRPLAVLEAKRNIRTDRELEDARKQGLSYALFEEVKPVLVAAPEGLWVYERHGQELEFYRKFDIEEAFEKIGELRGLVDQIAAGAKQRTAAGAHG